MKKKKQKFKIGDEVYFGGLPDIYFISADKENPSPNGTDILPLDWDYLITVKDGCGFTKVQEDLIRKDK